MKAIVLAAGRGSRMGSITKKIPKPMLNFGDKTILSRLLYQLDKRNISSITIVIGFMKDLIINEVRSHNFKNLRINFINNDDYENDTNIYSVYLGMKNINNEGVAIFESDCIYSERAMDQIIKSFQDLSSHWYTIGSFTKAQNGGILLSDQSKNILDIKIVQKYEDIYFHYKKLIGLLYISSKQCNKFKSELERFKNISHEYYYLQPWIENLKELPCIEVPLPKGSSAAFNNKIEYNSVLELM